MSSADSLAGASPTVLAGHGIASEGDGTWSVPAHETEWLDILSWPMDVECAEATSFAVSLHGRSDSTGDMGFGIRYRDPAGNRNVRDFMATLGREWQSFGGTLVVPSGMTVYEVHVSLRYADAAEISLPSLYAGASEMPVKARAQVALASVSDGARGDPGPKGSDGQMLVATSATAASTAAKVATLRSGTLSLEAGASVTVVFFEANTAASPTLNVGGTGARAIRTNGTPYAYWVAGTAVSFVYDGTYWQVCSVPVYASTVTVGNPGGPNVYIDSDSVDVRKAAAVLASFSASGASFLGGMAELQAYNGSGISLTRNGAEAVIASRIGKGFYYASAGHKRGSGYGVMLSAEDDTGMGTPTEAFLSSSGLDISKPLPVSSGGTGGSTPALALAALGLADGEAVFAIDTQPVSLDTCGPGLFKYGTATAGTPTEWGICMSFEVDGGNWRFQLALPTAGEPHWRRNINNSGWSSWWQWSTA